MASVGQGFNLKALLREPMNVLALLLIIVITILGWIALDYLFSAEDSQAIKNTPYAEILFSDEEDESMDGELE